MIDYTVNHCHKKVLFCLDGQLIGGNWAPSADVPSADFDIPPKVSDSA